MWEPRRLTTLWAFTVCYRDSFTVLTSCSRVACEKMIAAYPVMKFPFFCGTQYFPTVFRRMCHWNPILSHMNLVQILIPSSLRFILILSVYLYLGLSFSSHQVYQLKWVRFSSLSLCYMSRASNPTWFDKPNITTHPSQWPRGLGMHCLRPLKHWDRVFESR
jgi:hypothetical protein